MLEVSPQALRVSGQQLSLLAGAVPLLHGYVTQHLGAIPSIGLMSDAGPALLAARDQLLADYVPDRAGRVFTSAGEVLQALAADYERVDLEQAASYDARLPGGHEQHRPRGMDPRGETAGVDLAEIEAMVAADPGNAFTDWEEWRAMREGVDHVLSLEWVWNVVGITGAPDLSEQMATDLDLDWEAVGRAVAALRGVEGVWSKVRAEQAALVHQLDVTWSGNAADAAFAWFSTLDDTLEGHEKSLRRLADAIWDPAIGMRMSIDSLSDLMGILANLFAPISPQDLVEMLLKGTAGALLRKVLAVVDVMITLIDSMFALMGVMTMLFTHLGPRADVTFPSVAALAAPDVDGP